LQSAGYCNIITNSAILEILKSTEKTAISIKALQEMETGEKTEHIKKAYTGKERRRVSDSRRGGRREGELLDVGDWKRFKKISDSQQKKFESKAGEKIKV
jgi:hypothetical protein